MSTVANKHVPRERSKTEPVDGLTQSNWYIGWTRVIALTIAVVSAMFLSFGWLDELVCRRVTIEQMSGDFRKMFTLFELFGHGTGVLVTCLLVAFLDAEGRAKAKRIFLVCFSTGVATIVLKQFFIRTRPSVFLETISAGQTASTAIASKVPLSHPLTQEHGFFHDGVHSFPSGHTAMAFAMAFCLAQFYPRGRWVFAGIAVMVGAQRIVGQAHYISDVLAGACVGVAIAWAITRLTLKR